MTLVLDATPGSPTANSYGTLTEADAYFAGRPGAAAWAAADDPAKNQALVGGTMRLEQEEYDGYRYSQAQALKWPRFGLYLDGYPVPTGAVPAFVKAASFEEAAALLDDPDRLDFALLAQFEQIQVGPIDVRPRAEGLPTNDLTPTSARLLGPFRVTGSGSFRVFPA